MVVPENKHHLTLSSVQDYYRIRCDSLHCFNFLVNSESIRRILASDISLIWHCFCLRYEVCLFIFLSYKLLLSGKLEAVWFCFFFVIAPQDIFLRDFEVNCFVKECFGAKCVCVIHEEQFNSRKDIPVGLYSLGFSKTSINRRLLPEWSSLPSLSSTLQGSSPFTLPPSDLIVQFRMTGFHLQLPPGSAHLILIHSSCTWKTETLS